MAFDDNQRELSLGELENANTDRTVNPAVMVRGMAGRDTGGTWRYISVSASGALRNDDAANFRVSALGITFNADASNNRVSAVQLDAGNLMVSAKSGDAALLRVSAIGGTAGDRTLVDGSDQTISARIFQVSATISSNVNALVVRATNFDSATQFRTSAFLDSGSVSAKSSDASTMRVSAINSISSLSPDAGLFRVSSLNQDANFMHVSGFSPDASLFRISGILAAGVSSVGAASFGVSAAQIDASALRTSSIVDSGSISAKSGDANQVHVSSVQGDAGLLRMSGFTSTATNFPVSSTQGSANLLRISSFFGVDTTGQWTIGRLSNLSSSGNIKSTAGVVYGYYAYNTDTKPNYINFTNTSGAINVGTDTVLLKIMLPASAAANVGFPGGLIGFTAGIGAYGTSAIADNATTSVPTSAVGINVFFN